MPPYDIACLRAQAGQTDEAFRSLDQATDRHLDNLELVRTDPDLASLRADPRWPAFVARVEEEDRVAVSRSVQ